MAGAEVVQALAIMDSIVDCLVLCLINAVSTTQYFPRLCIETTLHSPSNPCDGIGAAGNAGYYQ